MYHRSLNWHVTNDDNSWYIYYVSRLVFKFLIVVVHLNRQWFKSASVMNTLLKPLPKLPPPPLFFVHKPFTTTSIHQITNIATPTNLPHLYRTKEDTGSSTMQEKFE